MRQYLASIRTGRTPLHAIVLDATIIKRLDQPGHVVLVELGQELVAFLAKKGGKADMGAIGGNVKKPPGTPKLKEYVKKNSEFFKIDGNAVSLK